MSDFANATKWRTEALQAWALLDAARLENATLRADLERWRDAADDKAGPVQAALDRAAKAEAELAALTARVPSVEVRVADAPEVVARLEEARRALAGQREDEGEFQVRLTGVESERDHYRLALTRARAVLDTAQTVTLRRGVTIVVLDGDAFRAWTEGR